MPLLPVGALGFMSTAAPAPAPAPAAVAPAALACPTNADAYQTSQNGYCADSYGWPLRPDGSVMTRQDIEAAARGTAVKEWWPYALGAVILLFMVKR